MVKFSKLESFMHFIFVVKLYIRNTPHVLLITLITFIAGVAQISASAAVVPIVGIIIKESSYGKSEQINIYMARLMKLFGMEMSILNLLILMVSLEFFCFMLVYVQERLVYYIRYVFVVDIRRRIMESIWRARWSSLLNHSSGETVSRLTVEAQRAGTAVFSLLECIVAVSYIFIFLIGFLFINWKLVLIVGFIVGISFYLTRGFQRSGYELGTEQTDKNNSFINLVIEFLKGLKLIKVSALEDYSNKLISVSSERNQKITKEIEDYQARINLFTSSFKSFTTGLIVFLALVILETQVSLLVLFFYLFLRVMPKIFLAQSRVLSFLTTCRSLEGIEEFRSQLVMGEDYDDRKKVYDRLKESVIFKNVSFSYGNLKVLDNINIEIHPKKTIGIVGPSGAGKSTLIDLLVGLHKPCEGEVLINSINLSKYNLKTFREHIGYVMQDDIMFNDTIYNNLIFGLSSVDTKWVEYCAKLANIYQFIIETPDGFNTNIGESGIRLSGGQKQRLSLARALTRRPDILILDEGTSALDSDSERVIRNSINNISHKMTIVMIAHRISTLADTDIIYVIDKGKCVESGTYTELLSVGGYFAKMHNLQLTQKS